MKRIGILTLHRANNFGAVLQNYALQKAIKRLGYECETIDYMIPQIDYEYKDVKFFRGKNPFKNCMGLYWDLKNKKQSQVSSYKFDEFRRRYLTLSSKSYDSLTIAEASYDLFIVGSDQVWNADIIRSNSISTFSLEFTDSRKASYAASCGTVKALIPLDKIREFDYITVRETELFDYLKKNKIHSEIVCDPTLLLTKGEWKDLTHDTVIDHGKYVYLYYIDSGRNDAACIAKDLARKNNLDVVYSKRLDSESERNHNGINRFSDGPLDFIKEIECADYVVVSSFHGVAFSILMEKNFIALLHENTGSRVHSLLRKLGLQDRIVKNFEDYQNRKFAAIDYTRVRPIIENWKMESIEHLRKICEL